MLIEYQLPLSSKRVDAVLAGVDHEGEDSYVVVELKQWSQAELYESNDRLVVVEGMHRELEHPLLSGAGLLRLHHRLRRLPCTGTATSVRGVAYLHNAV